MNNPRPISEAPRDGSPVELQYGEAKVRAAWSEEAGQWVLREPLVVDRLTDAQVGGYLPRRAGGRRASREAPCIRPIGFRTAMVKAILDGRKVQTRLLSSAMWLRTKEHFDRGGDCYLWLREAWAVGQHDVNAPPESKPRSDAVVHCATFRGEPAIKWKPSVHMPRHASRITLKVTGAETGPLQDITESDVEREGIRGPEDIESLWQLGLPPVEAFAQLWDELHKRPGTSWVENPQVVKFSFETINGNIDDVLATAS